MTVQSNYAEIRGIPFGQLILAPENVRKEDSETGLEELANLILAEGVLQNLAGYEIDACHGKPTEQYAVVAGGRRWRALTLLKTNGDVDDSYIVPMLVTSRERAIIISLMENAGRKELHPADEFEAFRALVDAGKSVEEVAAHFRTDVVLVQRRLKLANVSPEFIQLYRAKKLTLEILMALAVTDDHEKQRGVWKRLPAYARTVSGIRTALTEDEISSRDPLARFVTLKQYEKEGGQARRDLFSEDDNVFLQDVVLLTRLAQEKLDKRALQLKRKGRFAWVDAIPRLDYSQRAGYAAVQTTMREPTEEERAQLQKLDDDLEQVAVPGPHEEGESDEDEPTDEEPEDGVQRYERRRALRLKRQSLLDSLSVPDPEQLEKAGALVSIDDSGKVRVETGLLRSEDAKQFAARAREKLKAEHKESPRSHSAVLLLRLTAHRTQALQAEFARNPEVALAAVVHRFVIDTFPGYRAVSGSALRINGDTVELHKFAKDLESTPAHTWLDAQEKHLTALLPPDPQALFDWILTQSHHEKVALLAFCAAQSLDAVQNHERESDADVLARALNMDFRQWWTPSAEGYFNSVPKAITLQAVTEAASPEAAAQMEKLKKGPRAAEAGKALAGKGWLPPFLRTAWMNTNGSAALHD